MAAKPMRKTEDDVHTYHEIFFVGREARGPGTLSDVQREMDFILLL